MMHSLRTVTEIDEAEDRIRAALRDAIRDGSPVLADYYRTCLKETAAARTALIPEQSSP